MQDGGTPQSLENHIPCVYLLKGITRKTSNIIPAKIKEKESRKRLGDFLIQEAVFLGGVGNEAKLLQNELEWMQCYIANAEGKQVDDPMIRKWLSDITEISYDIEDVIDKIILQVHEKTTIDLDEEKKPAGGCFSPCPAPYSTRSPVPLTKAKRRLICITQGRGLKYLKSESMISLVNANGMDSKIPLTRLKERPILLLLLLAD
ncbi:hypothetical protein LWI29_010249 [Acer saccharum]|uniref:Disease resistance N-terminal domain-containing protein n=1 Tax=Acer saccharum TaxID=4024 RepID=A0AA39SBW8_ACESA|nr:hypothetical protein LWI29_010249 [Acer saccharum]